MADSALRFLLMILGAFATGCAAQLAPPARPAVEFIVRPHEPAARASPDSLTVATYNVRGLRQRDAVRRDLARLDHVTAWCLQEVPQQRAADVAAILPQGRWHVVAVAVNQVRTAEWESQVIASRLPLDGVEVWPLDDDHRGKRRVALAGRVTVGARSVLIVNTDHEPSILARGDGNAEQLRRLLEHLRPYSDDAVIVAGDFNCSGSLYRLVGNHAHVRRLDRALADDGFAPVDATGPTFRSGFVRARLDRIYTRNVRASAGAIATASRGSDHLPVWGRFEIAPGSPHRAISDAASAQ